MFLPEGNMVAGGHHEDKQAEAFVHKVYRIANKFMTNEFRVVDPKTLMPYHRDPTKSYVDWAGHHAMRWAAERRHNYIFGYLNPPDYDFGEDEPPA